MPEIFDPYYKWLGIPPAQQPPHHYRLLGIELFESDVEVIDMAANQRMSYLQEMAGGAHGKVSQRLLNEVSAARRCLLDKSAKAAYDEQLRAKTPKPATVVTESPPADDADDDDTINVAPTINIRSGSLPGGKFAPPKTAIGPPAKPAAAAESDTAFDFQVDETKAGKTNKSWTTVSKSTPSKTTPSKSSSSKSSMPKSSTSKSSTSRSKSSGTPPDDAAGEAEPAKRRKKKSRAVPLALTIILLAAAAGGGFELYRRSLTPKVEPVVAVVAIAAEHSSPASTTIVAPTGPIPNASPSSSVAAALEMFANAAKSQNPQADQSTAGGGGPATGAPAATAPSATAPSATAPKSAIVAAAEASPPDQLFLPGVASANAFAPGIHLNPQRNLPGRLVGFFKSGADYHLFYETVVIGRHPNAEAWGHAVCSDLLTWREVPLTVALDPKRLPSIGSIFVDAENASGLGEAGKPVWLAVATFPGADAKKAKAEIGYASSRDQGATWTFAKEPVKVEGGPAAESRWPRIVRDAERKQWCLVVHSKQVAKPQPAATYTLYTSPDLKTWTKKQDVPLNGGTGAPDFFEIAEAAPGKARRWIFAAANGRYMLGQFDGERFTSDNRGGQLPNAGYTWFRTLDDSAGETRRLAAAVIPAPAAAKQPPYGVAVALPVVFTLGGGEAAASLLTADCSEIGALGRTVTERPSGDLPAGAPFVVGDCGPTYRFVANFEAGQADAVELVLFGETVRFDFKAKTMTIAGVATPLEAKSVEVQGIVDREIAELRTSTGRVAFATRSGPGTTPFKIDAVGGPAKVLAVRVVPLVRPAGKP